MFTPQAAHTSRTGFEAKRLRSLHRNEPATLHKFGYHVTKPFTERHIHSDIYSALAPDLLHQASKCFYDYVHKWILDILAALPNSSITKAKGEMDARFSHLPPYPGLRMFRSGISVTSRWTGNEYKNMIRVYLGIIKGIVPNDVVHLVKTYLDCHQLAYYVKHTVDTLDMLDSAIYEFWKTLHDPMGTFSQQKIVPKYWLCPKLHYFQHYREWVLQNGALPFCSMDHTETWHKPLKAAFRASGKGPQVDQFILREEGRNLAWSIWEDDLLPNLQCDLSPESTAPDEDTSDAAELEEEVEPLIVKNSIERGKASRWNGLR